MLELSGVLRIAHLALAALPLLACATPPSDPASQPDDTATQPDNPTPPGPTVDVWGPRADAALESMLLHYWTGATLQGTAYWTYAQAWDAVLDGVERTGRYRGWIETMYLAQDARGWRSDFYDDENWMALALLRAHDLTGTQKYLDRARDLFADIEAAWDTTCCGSTPGGFWWDRAHTQKATASNAGPVITAVRLWTISHDAHLLDVAKRAYAYWRAHMTDPATFQVFDHVAPNGTITKWQFTYNEGAMLGAALALHEATGDAAYLADARAIGARMVAAETHDGVLFDGNNTDCNGDCQQFKGIGYRYLQALQDTDPTPAVATVLDKSADALWANARSGDTRFAPDWNGPTVSSPAIEAESSAVMALEVHARAKAMPAQPSDGLRYEAEDAVLHSMHLEAFHGTYGAWGYLAGWHGDGTWVDFHVTSPGTAKVTLRYAANDGDASRFIYVDGQDAIANQTFPSTGSWDAWQTVTMPLALAAGEHTISVIYNGSKGSSQYLNLDTLELGN